MYMSTNMCLPYEIMSSFEEAVSKLCVGRTSDRPPALLPSEAYQKSETLCGMAVYVIASKARESS